MGTTTRTRTVCAHLRNALTASRLVRVLVHVVRTPLAKRMLDSARGTVRGRHAHAVVVWSAARIRVLKIRKTTRMATRCATVRIDVRRTILTTRTATGFVTVMISVLWMRKTIRMPMAFATRPIHVLLILITILTVTDCANLLISVRSTLITMQTRMVYVLVRCVITKKKLRRLWQFRR